MHRLAFLVVAALAPLLAAAGERVLWICSLTQDATRLACIADADAADAQEAPRPVAAAVRGTTFPLDARRMYTVDLWSPATEMDFVEQLAYATICYRSAGCGVLLVRERGAPAPPVLARR